MFGVHICLLERFCRKNRQMMNSKKTSVNHRFITYRSDEIIGIIGIPAICEYTLRPVISIGGEAAVAPVAVPCP